MLNYILTPFKPSDEEDPFARIAWATTTSLQACHFEVVIYRIPFFQLSFTSVSLET